MLLKLRLIIFMVQIGVNDNFFFLLLESCDLFFERLQNKKNEVLNNIEFLKF
jgi:hypothetical protein